MGLGYCERDEIDELLRTVKSNPGLHCINALKKLWDLAGKDDYRETLCHPSFQLLPTLRWILDTFHDDEMIIKLTTGILWYISRHPAGRFAIGSSDSRIVPLIFRKAHTRNPTSHDHIINLLSNLSLDERVHLSLLKRENRFFEFFQQEMEKKPTAFQLYKAIAGFTKCATNDSLKVLVESRIHVTILNLFISAPTLEVSKWEGNGNGPLSWALSFATAFSSMPAGAAAIRQWGHPELFIELMKQTLIEGIEAAMIVANVYGKDESSTNTRAILVSHTSILSLLVDLLDLSLNYSESSDLFIKYRKERKFVYGFIRLRDITAALKHLSISDANKTIMMEQCSSRLLLLICPIITAFIQDRDEYQQVINASFRQIVSFGGGGKDLDSIENTLELLVQLSFFYEDDDDLQDAFLQALTPRYDLTDLLLKLINLPDTRSLPYEAKRYCSPLLGRLTAPRRKPLMMKTPASNPPSVLRPRSSIKKEGDETKEEEEIVSVEKSEGNDNSTLTTPAPRLQRSSSTLILQRMHSVSNLPNQRHVMLSYSWAKNKSLVIALGRKLRELGYDVWRDEEGSTLLPAMSGDIVEAMAEAIQYSHTMIICVSPEYKESPNCRAEAKYARTRQQRNGLQLLYVMMDENYHTHSSQQVVDGWLGFMIGADLWYPLWSLDQLEKTATSLSELIGDNAKAVPGVPLMRNDSSSSISSVPSRNANNPTHHAPAPVLPSLSQPPAPAHLVDAIAVAPISPPTVPFQAPVAEVSPTVTPEATPAAVIPLSSPTVARCEYPCCIVS